MLHEGRRVVAIPARDEAERIGDCLEALDNQDVISLDDIVVFVNNSSDDTAAVARQTKLRPCTRLHVIERMLPRHEANAGHARRVAMQAASAIAGPAGVLLTTDADGLVDPDWVLANVIALGAGADVVAGWVDLHPLEWAAIPARLHEDDARECAYDALCDEIHSLLDPDAADPFPRHTQHSGASIAVTAAAFVRCGGVPSIASGEDRALIAALRRVDACIRHAPEVHVTVSGRLQGRAAGGMAETILRRMSQPDCFLDDRLEPAADCARRAMLKSACRKAHARNDTNGWADRLRLPDLLVRQAFECRYFGAAWQVLEAPSSILQTRRVAAADLCTQTASARAILDSLRQKQHTRLDLPIPA